MCDTKQAVHLRSTVLHEIFFFLINQNFSNAFQQNYLLYVFMCYTGLACEMPG